MSRTIRVRDPDSAFTGRYNTAGDNANSNHAAKKKIPSVWLLAKWWLKERGWPVNNRKKPYLRLLSY